MHPPSPPGPRAPQPAGNPKLVAWFIGVALVGCVLWVVYVLAAAYQGAEAACGSDLVGTLAYQGGGQASAGSLVMAAALGAALWIACGAVAFARRRNLGLVFASFVALNIVGLVVVWGVSPLIWGPRHC